VDEQVVAKQMEGEGMRIFDAYALTRQPRQERVPAQFWWDDIHMVNQVRAFHGGCT
jgi:hypothetical protein